MTPQKVYKAAISSKLTTAHDFYIGDFRPLNSPSDDFAYPHAPFTCNILDGVVSAFRGRPYVGYQAPDYYADIGSDKLDGILDMFLDSQRAYSKQLSSGKYHFFAQVYNWNYWDGGDFEDQNIGSFGWDGNDPNSRWEGYSGRAILSVARALYLQTDNVKARDCTSRYLKSLDRWFFANPNKMPTDFIPVGDPVSFYTTVYYPAKLLQAAIYANLAGVDAEITWRIIKNCYDFLKTEYQPTGVMQGSFSKTQGFFDGFHQQYFLFWHASIIDALSLLAEKYDDINLPPC